MPEGLKRIKTIPEFLNGVFRKGDITTTTTDWKKVAGLGALLWLSRKPWAKWLFQPEDAGSGNGSPRR